MRDVSLGRVPKGRPCLCVVCVCNTVVVTYPALHSCCQIGLIGRTIVAHGIIRDMSKHTRRWIVAFQSGCVYPSCCVGVAVITEPGCKVVEAHAWRLRAVAVTGPTTLAIIISRKWRVRKPWIPCLVVKPSMNGCRRGWNIHLRHINISSACEADIMTRYAVRTSRFIDWKNCDSPGFGNVPIVISIISPYPVSISNIQKPSFISVKCNTRPAPNLGHRLVTAVPF